MVFKSCAGLSPGDGVLGQHTALPLKLNEGRGETELLSGSWGLLHTELRRRPLTAEEVELLHMVRFDIGTQPSRRKTKCGGAWCPG